MSQLDIYNNKEIDAYSEALLLCFYKNNSRLISAAEENKSQHNINSTKKIDFDEGTILITNRDYSISGYCLGTYISVTQHYIYPNVFELYARNDTTITNLTYKNWFALKVQLEIIKDKNQLYTSNMEEYSVNNLEGSIDLFIKWHDKALNKRFPMSKHKNIFARYFY